MKRKSIIIIVLGLQVLGAYNIQAKPLDIKAFQYESAFDLIAKEMKAEKLAEEAKLKAGQEEVTLSFAGDVALGTYYGQAPWNRFDEVASVQESSYFFQNVYPIFSQDDLTVVNLEGPLTSGGVRQEKQFAIKGDPSYTQYLVDGSIESVALANNHTYDYGAEGYRQTKEHLAAKGIGYFGYEKIAYHQVKDMKVALIGAKGWDASQSAKDRLTQQINEAKQHADLVVMMFHWGEERQFYPNTTQQTLAYHVIDAGVDLVVGGHPHVIQGIETYKGKQIVYSLGNFCFGANKNPTDKDAFIYQATFRLTDEGIEAVSSEVIPCSISSVRDRNNYQPTPLEGSEKERVMERLSTYSEGFKQSYFKQ